MDGHNKTIPGISAETKIDGNRQASSLGGPDSDESNGERAAAPTVKKVKSVVRVLDILKLFHEEQRALRAVDIAERLNLPAASTHEILKTMLDQGFFTFGDPKGMYKPSNRFPEIVEWVRDSVCEDPQLSKMMAALNEATQENIILAGQADLRAKIYGSLPCRYEFGVNSKRGTLLSPTQSLVGIALLSHFEPEAREKFMERLRYEDATTHDATDVAQLEAILDEIEKTGIAIKFDLEVEGIGAICCPIESPSSLHGLVIGIVGPARRIKSNQKEHIETLTSILRAYRVPMKQGVNVQ